MKKKVLYIVGVILLILIVTNPSYSSFLGFLDEQEFSTAERKANYIVCSIYSVEFNSDDFGHKKENYFAMLGGFYKIN